MAGGGTRAVRRGPDRGGDRHRARRASGRSRRAEHGRRPHACRAGRPGTPRRLHRAPPPRRHRDAARARRPDGSGSSPSPSCSTARPLGTDTTGAVSSSTSTPRSCRPAGTGCGIEAVDRLGGRKAAKPVRVRITPQQEPATLTATPGTFRSVLRALAGGHVIVRLAPGRYVVPHLELGSGAAPGRLRAADGARRGDRRLVADDRARPRRPRLRPRRSTARGRAERAIGVAAGSHDVRLQRLRIGGIRRDRRRGVGRALGHLDPGLDDRGGRRARRRRVRARVRRHRAT